MPDSNVQGRPCCRLGSKASGRESASEQHMSHNGLPSPGLARRLFESVELCARAHSPNRILSCDAVNELS